MKQVVKQGGYSLPEVLIASGLSALLLTVLMGLLVPSLRLGLRMYTHLSQTESALLALGKIKADLRQTAPPGLHLQSDQMVIQPMDWLTASSTCTWKTQWIGYSREADRLVRKVGPAPEVNISISWDPSRPQLPTSSQMNGARTTLLLRNLKSFSLTLPVTPGTEPIVAMRLTLEDSTDPAAPVWEVTDQVHLRSPGL